MFGLAGLALASLLAFAGMALHSGPVSSPPPSRQADRVRELRTRDVASRSIAASEADPAIEGERKSFCSDPYAYVCDSSDTSKASRLARILSLKERAFKRTVARATYLGAITDEEADKIQSDADLLLTKRDAALEFSKRLTLSRMYLEEMSAETESLSRKQLEYLEPLFDLIKSYVMQTLVSEFPAALGPEAGMKYASDMVTTLREVQLVMPWDVLAKVRDEQAANDFLESYFNVCSSDTLGDNAFAQVYEGKDGKRHRVVTVCNGFLAANAGEDEQSARDGALRILGHELGHHIDTSAGGGRYFLAYSRYLACIQSSEEFAQEALPYRNDEIIADYWGNIAAGMYLNDVYDEEEVARRLTAARRMVSRHCGSTSERWDDHPPGSYRIAKLYRLSPLVHEALSCGNELSRSTCTLKGRIPLLDRSPKD